MPLTPATLLTAACLATPAQSAPAPTPAAAYPLTAHGTVYHDRDGDRLRSPGEPGIPGVRVSNGVDVTLTDADGRWQLPVPGECVIHVVKPAGWMTPLNALHLPRFSHPHRPTGSPDGLKYAGLAPTGPLPASIDFPLDRHEEPETFRVIVHGDPQPYSMAEVAWFGRDVMAEVARSAGPPPATAPADAPAPGIPTTPTTPAFGISLGDLVGDNLDLYQPFNETQAMAGIPWYNVYGNHDMNFLAADDTHAAETFIRVFGAADYAFQWGRAHFIALDDVVWKGPTYRSDGSLNIGNYHGGLSEAQIAFVRNYLATVPQDELIVLLMHIPLLSTSAQHSVANRRELLEVLSTHPNTLSLSGHTHLQRMIHFGSEDGYTAGTEHLHANLATASGTWYRGHIDIEGIPDATMICGAPNGWNVLTVDGTRYTLDFVPARRPRDHQMSIWIPADEIAREALAAGEAEVVVNVFAGSDRSRVRMRLRPTGTGGEPTAWTDLAQTLRPDPFLVARKALERSDTPPTGRPLPGLENSHHIWAAALPADLPAGHHVIEVETTDMFGRTFRAVRGVWVRD